MGAARKLSEEQIVEKLDELPTLPTVIYELSQIINDPMSSTNEVVEIMENDVSMTTKVLKLANSAYYAIPGGVSSLSRAISYLGFDTVNQLLLSSSIIQAMDIKGEAPLDMAEFWKHCIGVAIAAETIAKETHHPLPSDLFTAGLVHDMGKIAYFTVDPEAMITIVQHAEKENCSYSEAESQLELIKHTSIGSMLATKWQLPTQMQAVIKYHHETSPERRVGLSSELNNAVDIVCLSNILVHALKFGHSGHTKVIGAQKDLLERLTIEPNHGFKQLLKKIKDSLESAQGFIQIIGGQSA